MISQLTYLELSVSVNYSGQQRYKIWGIILFRNQFRHYITN